MTRTPPPPPAQANSPEHDTAPALPAFTPVPRQCNRHDGWTADRQRRFISALADTGSVEAACRAVGKSSVGAYHLRRHPEAAEFRAAWDAALDHGVRRLEDLAMDRALNGVEVPVYSYGKLVGSRTVYNDRLLMFLLRNRAPERFAEGRAKAMSALDKETLARLKRKWRAEWEAEAAAEEQAVYDSIDTLIDEMRSREHGHLGPPAPAPCDPDADNDPAAQASETADTPASPPPGWRRMPRPDPEPDPFPRWHSPRDEGWD